MYQETPNQQEIDWMADRLREIYDYERLKNCDIDFLYNLEFRVRATKEVFQSGFPSGGSHVQGTDRIYILNNPNETKEALTQAEKMRMSLLMDEITVEIRRAYGHRKELRREHRNKIVNSISDTLSGIGNLAPW